jgi:hypothetical protein
VVGRHWRIDRSDLNRVKGIDLELCKIGKVGVKGIGGWHDANTGARDQMS